jgi:hypothetical protein
MKTFSLLLLSVSSVAFSQEDAWVYFNAKSDSQSYLDSPLNYSKRALERRANQNIAIDLKDVPITPAYINQIKSISGIGYGKIKVDECAPYPRKSIGYKFVKRIHFVKLILPTNIKSSRENGEGI